MVEDFSTDWRLSGQERYLNGAVLRRSKYRQRSADWDHDHCAFCWAKFMEHDYPDQPPMLHEGYTANNGYHWICDRCFRDFRSLFAWKVENDDSSD